MNFKLWLERNFISLPPSVEAQIETIAASVYPNAQISQGTQLGEVKMGPARIKVVVRNLRTGDAAFDPMTSTIYVTPATAKDRHHLQEMLRHELTHAYDPETAKLMLRNMNGQNARALDPREGKQQYFQQRTEFNAYGTQLAGFISTALSKMPKQKADKHIAKLKDWLRTDNFPGFFGLIKSLFGFGPMPQILVPFYSAQKAWKQDPRLWRQFKQKLFSLIQQQENPKVGVPVEFPAPAR